MFHIADIGAVRDTQHQKVHLLNILEAFKMLSGLTSVFQKFRNVSHGLNFRTSHNLYPEYFWVFLTIQIFDATMKFGFGEEISDRTFQSIIKEFFRQMKL